RPQSRQALERRDRLAGNCCDRGHAAPDLLAVQQHRAGTALRQAAAEARAVQVQLVVQDVQERRIEARGHVVHETVDLDLQLARHISLHLECFCWQSTAETRHGTCEAFATAACEPYKRPRPTTIVRPLLDSSV